MQSDSKIIALGQHATVCIGLEAIWYSTGTRQEVRIAGTKGKGTNLTQDCIVVLLLLTGDALGLLGPLTRIGHHPHL